MKMKIAKHIFILASVLLTMLVMCSAANVQNEDERWQAEYLRYDLQDKEKILLKKNDELDRNIIELKQKIKSLHDELDNACRDKESLKHELIIVRLKLLK